MDELVYNTLVQYFKLLANFGYVNYTNVYKVLFLISMQDLTTGGFRSLITEDDYRQIERALYKIFGTSGVSTVLVVTSLVIGIALTGTGIMFSISNYRCLKNFKDFLWDDEEEENDSNE